MTRPILKALEAAEIPYIVGGMNRLFETLEVQAMREAFFFLAGFTPNGGQLVTAVHLENTLKECNLGLTSKGISAGVKLLERRKAKIGRQMDAELYLQRARPSDKIYYVKLQF